MTGLVSTPPARLLSRAIGAFEGRDTALKVYRYHLAGQYA